MMFSKKQKNQSKIKDLFNNKQNIQITMNKSSMIKSKKLLIKKKGKNK